MLKRMVLLPLAIMTNFFCCGTNALATGAASTPAPSIRLTKIHASEFYSAISDLSVQGHVCFVMEGIPLKPHLTDKAVADLTVDMPLVAAVAKIAAAYDYDARREGGVFVLTKRYTDPTDLPDVTLEECQAAINDVLCVLDAFSPHFAESIYADGPDDRKDTVISFFHSLSARQLQRAQDKSLHYGDLVPEQQGMIRSLFLYQFDQVPRDKVADGLNELDHAPLSVLTARNEQGFAGVFMEMPTPLSASKPILIPISGGMTPLDRAQPNIISATPPPGAVSSMPSDVLLESVVAGLKPIDGQRGAVEKLLQKKPVTVFGLENARPMDVLRALAVVYGLRIGATDAGAPKLMRRPAPVPEDPRDLPSCVWSILPMPFVRALHIVPVDSSDVAGNASRTSSSAAVDAVKLNPQHIQQLRFMELPNGLRQEAIRRILLAMRPRLIKEGLGAHVAVASLDQDARRALAVALMIEAVTLLKNSFSGEAIQHVLNCLDNMDQIIVYTIPSETARIKGQNVPSLYFAGIDPTTNVQIGLGGVRYISHD